MTLKTLTRIAMLLGVAGVGCDVDPADLVVNTSQLAAPAKLILRFPASDATWNQILTTAPVGSLLFPLYPGNRFPNHHPITDGTPFGAGAFLDSIALHEVGHFLGLAHSADPSAAMSEEVHDGSVARVELARDDAAAICAVFPPSLAHREPPSGGWPGSTMAPLIVAAVIAAGLLGWARRPGRLFRTTASRRTSRPGSGRSAGACTSR